jgi:Fic family protein
MFSPKYTLSPTLLTHITTIERLYGQIEALKLPKKLELHLNRDNLIQSSYASNKIEGNPLTLPEVTNLLLDDRIPANRDEKEVVNYFDVLTALPEYRDRQLTTALVEELHGKIFAGVHNEAGVIRDERVVVGKYTGETGGSVSFKVKHDPPYHKRELIEASLQALLSWVEAEEALPAVIRTGTFHHEFVYIHPFEDGNGRVCRILTALLFIKAGYEINKYFVLDDYYDIDRTLYSDKLHSADEGDKTTWLEYFSEGVMYSLQSALSRAEAGIRRLSIADRPTKKEAEVIRILTERPEVTSTEVAETLSVSRQQAHNLLRSLVEKGLVERKGSTKSSYYRLK